MAGTPTEFEPVPPEVMARPTVRLRRPVRRRAPVLVAATVTTLWAALVSYLPVVALVGLLTGAWGSAFRFGTGFWLLGHGVPVTVGEERLALVPLALSVLAGWRVNRAGVHTARAIGARDPLRALLAAGAVALVYAGLGALGANLVKPLVAPVAAALWLGGFALVLGGIGALAESRVLGRVAGRLPPLV